MTYSHFADSLHEFQNSATGVRYIVKQWLAVFFKKENLDPDSQT